MIQSPTADQTLSAGSGETATMGVTATGANTYQWYVDQGDGKGFVAIPQTGDTASLTAFALMSSALITIAAAWGYRRKFN